jgi:hypothetical protein
MLIKNLHNAEDFSCSEKSNTRLRCSISQGVLRNRFGELLVFHETTALQ